MDSCFDRTLLSNFDRTHFSNFEILTTAGYVKRQQFSFCPERGCVVSTSRSTSTQYQAVLRLHALRLVLRTQPRSAK